MDLIVRGNRILCADGNLREGTIIIRNGQITELHHDRNIVNLQQCQEIDAGDLLVSPGLVDCHVHVNEPGRTDWEGYHTATKAAAAGGITTIIDMPLNSIPSTTTVAAFENKLNKASEVQRYVDVGFWGGVVPGNQKNLRPMIGKGIAGFKCFMIHSGVDDFKHVNEEDIRTAMEVLKGTGVPLMFHAELELGVGQPEGDVKKYSTFLNSRPDSMEVEAIKLVISLCKETRIHCHIVHLATAEALDIIKEAKADGLPLTVETTNHYLAFSAENVPDGATEYKCCPPIRGSETRELLWKAVQDGTIDMVISDHSPCTTDLKCQDTGDFVKAWGGIGSVQFGLSLFWTGLRDRGGTYKDMMKSQCIETARLCGMGHRKGKLEPGYDADIVIWDPEAKLKIQEESVHHKNKLTPFLNKEYYGVVHKTIVRGQVVFDEGKFTDTPQGELLMRKPII